ncbi:Dyp-type peroxidase [Silvibacterium sp.]|uniref:Dyp-type peroxidase n=1 Tax=Silvibacterium sp. TaxID=1964179 RepID=UPI0039E670AF
MSTPSELNEVVLPQTVVGPLTRAAIFLVLSIRPDDASYDLVRGFCGGLSSLIRAVEFRDVEAGLTCVAGFGSDAWDRLFGAPRPAELHPFREIRSGARHAVATPGDILFHIRAKRMDLCFELAAQIMDAIGDAVTVADEVHGFRYFDDRDVMGFVDGTENPRGVVAKEAAIIGNEDPVFEGGSYVIVQKYMHDLKAWNTLPTEMQEKIIGRKKLSDIELSDAEKPAYAHNALTNVEENGVQLQILRDNMPFGRPGHGEFGTYFIGYCRTPRVTEKMLENMFIGNPPGNYDRILDFSTAVTGGLFFVPTGTFLDNVSPEEPASAGTSTEAAEPAEEPPAATSIAVAPASSATASAATGKDTSLGIGSLKGEKNDE